MAKQYVVTNPSSQAICVVGRRRLEIPAQCEKLPCAFSGDEEAKITIAKLKRRYPLLKFEAAEDNAPAEGDAEKPAPAGQKEPHTPDAPAPTEAKPEDQAAPVLMDADTFAKKATVKRAANGKCTVTVEGLEKPLNVQLTADEPVENAVPRAFEQYAGEHKE